jgi:prolyl oligopeptidase
MIIRKIDTRNQIPGVGTAGGFSGKKEKTFIFFFTNYITPGSIFV